MWNLLLHQSELSPTKPLLAVYISAHGYGHVVRTSVFLERLLELVDFELDVTAPCSRTLWPGNLAEHTRSWRELPCDAGVVQAHELAVDQAATEAALNRWDREYDRRVAEEVLRLRDAAAVLGDVPPLASAAAQRAGLPSFALANFTWDWIYSRMGFEHAAQRAAEAYRTTGILFELEPCAPMTAFPRKLAAGVLGRTRRPSRDRVRRRLEVGAVDRLVLLAFKDPSLCALPPSSSGIRYVRPQAWQGDSRGDVAAVDGFEFVDLLSAADAVVAKTGYGIIGDAAASGTRLLYAVREGFPEDEVLARWLAERRATRRVDADRLRGGEWLGALESCLGAEAPAPEPQHRLRGALETVATALSS